MPVISVVFATLNRYDVLAKTLESLERQVFKDFEVVIADLNKEKISIPDHGLSLKVIALSENNVSRARNIAIAKSSGKYVLIIGDDQICDPLLLERHMRIQDSHPDENIAVHGLSDWDESMDITPYMRFLAPSGAQFNYSNIKDPSNCGFFHFLTCNLSLKRELLLEEPFDEKIPFAYEDVELGYRMEKNHHLRVIYDKDAITLHHHMVSEDDFFRKLELSGFSLVYVYRKHPEFKNIPLLKFKLMIAMPLLRVLRRIKFKKEIYWRINHEYHYAKGLLSGFSSEKKAC